MSKYKLTIKDRESFLNLYKLGKHLEKTKGSLDLSRFEVTKVVSRSFLDKLLGRHPCHFELEIKTKD